MSADAILEAVHALNPRTLGRARRLTVALELLRQGHTRGEAIALIQQRCSISRVEAWRLVDMASDMAGNPEPSKPGKDCST